VKDNIAKCNIIYTIDRQGAQDGAEIRMPAMQERN